jgi:hypothetical protein
MPGFALTTATQASCTHLAPAMIAPAQTGVLVLGSPVATSGSQIPVVGCPFPPTGTPHPCVLVRWGMLATKVLVGGQPALLMPPPGTGVGPGACIAADQAPQGVPTVRMNQSKVFMT